MTTNKDDAYCATRFIILLFILLTTISYGYALYYNRYNGDFLRTKVALSQSQLFFNYIISLLPYIGLWIIYKHFKKKPANIKKIEIPVHFFKQFLYFVFFASTTVTLLYGVGKMGAPAYQAPTLIKSFIIVLNRFPLLYLGMVFILLSNNKSHILIIATMMVILGILRAGLGVFLCLALVFILKYYANIFRFVKRRWLLIIIISIFSPFLVQKMYSLRSSLRDDYRIEKEDLITGKLCGRLSTFGNYCFIMQNSDYFKRHIHELDGSYYQKMAASAVVGESMMPGTRPEKMIIEAGGSSSKNVGFMCGVPGILLISSYKSPWLLWVNLLTIIMLVICAFKIARRFDTPFANEIAFLFMIYPVLSGVGSEYALFGFILLSFFVFILVVKLLSAKKQINSPKTKQQ
ncbi:MAG: oligosaccharide repeat unit polymerase [Prevotellaceae bacterium]|jgi:hypothetical protein|nr:oligosaccharide repeat unit polymerase [Prevotellaceae bacterium]